MKKIKNIYNDLGWQGILTLATVLLIVWWVGKQYFTVYFPLAKEASDLKYQQIHDGTAQVEVD